MNKLRKSKYKKIFGVCGGVAEYMGVDPTLVRVLASVGLVFSFGTGVVVYIVLGGVMPQSE